MMTGSGHNNHRDSTDLPEWADCDCFCIHGYAGTGASPCGWRGRLDETGEKRICPRCGLPTIIPLHLDHSSEAEA